jgi:hypothetical protein
MSGSSLKNRSKSSTWNWNGSRPRMPDARGYVRSQESDQLSPLPSLLRLATAPPSARAGTSLRGWVSSAEELRTLHDGDYVKTVGMVIARQCPGTAMGFIFLSMEDETGIANVIVTPDLYECERLGHPMGNQTLSADEPDGRSRRHRLTLCSGPHGGQSKTTPTQQPSKVRAQTESAKNSGHYPERIAASCVRFGGRERLWANAAWRASALAR